MAEDGRDRRPAGGQRGWHTERSPDHTHLLFDSVDEDGNTQIATVRPDGTDIRQLTRTPEYANHGVWW